MLLRATLHLGSYIFVLFSKKSPVPLNCELSSVLWCPFIILANCSEGGSHSSLTCGIFGCFDGEIGWPPPFIGCCLAQGVLNYLHSILKIDFFSCSAPKIYIFGPITTKLGQNNYNGVQSKPPFWPFMK